MEADKTQKLLKEKLKEKGLKVTHQRLLVLSVLEENSGSHMTAEDIYDLVSEDYPEIGLATVYRTLQLLWDMQLVDRINFGDGYVVCALMILVSCLYLVYLGYSLYRMGHA